MLYFKKYHGLIQRRGIRFGILDGLTVAVRAASGTTWDSGKGGGGGGGTGLPNSTASESTETGEYGAVDLDDAVAPAVVIDVDMVAPYKLPPLPSSPRWRLNMTTASSFVMASARKLTTTQQIPMTTLTRATWRPRK